MPFLLAKILNFQGTVHLIGVGSLSMIYLIHGNILATVHQKANGNYVIEIKTRHIASKTLINSVKF